MNAIKGLGVALVTPFDDSGEVDFAALGRVVEHVVTGGVNYLVALGTTAETPTLSTKERHRVLAFIKEHNAGRLPIVVGCGGNDTGQVCQTMNATDLAGVSAVLSVVPYYNKPSQEGLYRHFRQVADSSPVPVVLYNIPGRTGVNMTAKTILRIAAGGNVAGVKEACGAMPQITELLCDRPEGFLVISGDDALALPIMAMGGDGDISVTANAFPQQMSALVRACQAGDYQLAAALNIELHRIFDAIFAEGNPTGVKAALAAQGIIEPFVRLPLIEGSEQLMEFFRSTIQSGGERY